MVGMPMPSTMPAMAVSTSASSSMFCARPTTICVNTMPSPVMVTQPMTMPAQAQAMATDSVFLAPSSSASSTLRQVMPSRVALRSSAIGRHISAPDQRAQRRGVAERQADENDDDGDEQVAALASTWPSRGSSLLGTPCRPRRLASKCTAKNTAT